MGERSNDPDQLLRRGLTKHHFIDIRDAIEQGAKLRHLIDDSVCDFDWIAQHIVLSDVRHRLNLLLYPQLYENEAGDLYDLIMDANRHYRYHDKLNNLILFYAFELETWEVDMERRFVFGTTISFYILARKAIENGASYYSQIESSELFKTKYLQRICTWFIQGRQFDIGVSSIEYFEQMGLFARGAYDLVLKESIVTGNIELLKDMIDRSANIGAFIDDLEQDICNIHILNWPEHDLFGLFKDKGLLAPMRLNRLKNRLIFHANQLLKKSLTEQWNFEGSKDYELTIKSLEAGATFDEIIDNDDVITRILFMTYSAYYPEDINRSKRVLDFFESNGVCIEKLSIQLVKRLYHREVPYYEHMKLPIINSCVLENLYGKVSIEIDEIIWQIIFMMIMKEKMMEIKLTRRWQFSRRNMIQTAKAYRQAVLLNQAADQVVEENSSSDSEDSDTDNDSYRVSTSSSSDDEGATILEYFSIFGLKSDVGFRFYVKSILQCVRRLEAQSNLVDFDQSKGIVCRKCHDSYLNKYNPSDCVCFSIMEDFIAAGVNYHRPIESTSPIDTLLPYVRDFSYSNTFLNTIIAVLVEHGANVSDIFAPELLLIPQVRELLTYRNSKLTTKIILHAILNSSFYCCV